MYINVINTTVAILGIGTVWMSANYEWNCQEKTVLHWIVNTNQIILTLSIAYVVFSLTV